MEHPTEVLLLPRPRNSFLRTLDAFFSISDRGSSIATEVKAGVVLFATMCYIIPVNAEILAAGGMRSGPVATATALSAMISTLVLGMYANLPFGLASGMGLNTMFVYEIIRQRHLSPAEVLTCQLLAGLLLLFVGVSGAASRMVRLLPLSIKKALVVGIGLFQAIIGLVRLGFIHPGQYTLLELNEWTGAEQLVAIFAVAFTAILILLEVPGAILVGIVSSLAVAIAAGLASPPDRVFSVPELDFFVPQWEVLLKPQGIISFSCMFVVLFIDTSGVLVGMGSQGESLLDTKGELINGDRAINTLGVGVVIGAILGTSPIVVFLESTAAINQGGRTGLTSLVGGALLGASAFVVPSIKSIPECATLPMLILIGSFMIGATAGIAWDRIGESLPAFLCIVMIGFTCSITNGIVAGLVMYWIVNSVFVIAKVTKWDWLVRRLVEDESSPLQSRIAREVAEEHGKSPFAFHGPEHEHLQPPPKHQSSTLGWW